MKLPLSWLFVSVQRPPGGSALATEETSRVNSSLRISSTRAMPNCIAASNGVLFELRLSANPAFFRTAAYSSGESRWTTCMGFSCLMCTKRPGPSMRWRHGREDHTGSIPDGSVRGLVAVCFVCTETPHEKKYGESSTWFRSRSPIGGGSGRNEYRARNSSSTSCLVYISKNTSRMISYRA